MSINLECEFFEYRQGQWYYALQSETCSATAWDWREEDPTVAVPFSSEDVARDHLGSIHGNTGGSSVSLYADITAWIGRLKPGTKTIYDALVKLAATQRRATVRPPPRRRPYGGL